MHSADFDKLVKTAIRERRLVAFILDGRPRLGEPHDYGLIDGEPRLFFYQVGGESRSGRPRGWRWAVPSKVSSCTCWTNTLAVLGPCLPGDTSKGTRCSQRSRRVPEGTARAIIAFFVLTRNHYANARHLH